MHGQINVCHAGQHLFNVFMPGARAVAEQQTTEPITSWLKSRGDFVYGKASSVDVPIKLPFNDACSGMADGEIAILFVSALV